MKVMWIVEERINKRRAWSRCDVFPDSKGDAVAIVAHFRKRAADWTDLEYRVVKYVREETSK